MGREVRMVPKGWQHPKDERGRFIPLLGGDYREHADEWCANLRRWMDGKGSEIEHFSECHAENPIDSIDRFVEFIGSPPQFAHYMPLWVSEVPDHFMMYEDTSEGTPISPAFATAEELADWLAATGASAFGSMTATREEWLATIKAGSSVGLIFENGTMRSGVGS